jgi:Uma2 family endonuclease
MAGLFEYMTLDEFLAAEQTATVRHEYLGGVLYALAGGTDWHNEIVLNVASRLHLLARGTDYRVYANDMLLRIDDATFYYPDVMVVYDRTDRRRLYRTNPCLVVEVLSPSTASTDRREKQLAYRRLTNLLGYLVVSQDERRVERHCRDPGGQWANEVIAGVGDVLIPCPEMALSLDDIYQDIDWSAG